MSQPKRVNKIILIECILLVALFISYGIKNRSREEAVYTSADGNYIKWVDFTISYEALCKAYEWDITTHETKRPLNWIELLAYAAAKTGGKFDKKALKEIDEIAGKITEK